MIDVIAQAAGTLDLSQPVTIGTLVTAFVVAIRYLEAQRVKSAESFNAMSAKFSETVLQISLQNVEMMDALKVGLVESAKETSSLQAEKTQRLTDTIHNLEMKLKGK